MAATPEVALAIVDPGTGRALGRFGEVDVSGVDHPITLNSDGTVAVTVESTGRVRIWWVGDDNPIATFMADAAQPRWLSQQFAPQSATAVAADASRLAVRVGAGADRPTHWIIIDTDVSSWLTRACDLAGRTLQDSEAGAIGLAAGQRECAR